MSKQKVLAKIDTMLPKSGGTMTGSLILKADPINDLEAATKKYVDDNISSADGNYISASGGEYNLKNAISFKNIPMDKTSMSFISQPYTKANNDIVTYETYLTGNFFATSNGSDTIKDYQSILIMPEMINILDNHIAGDHRHAYLTSEMYQVQRYDGGWKNFYIKAEKDRTQIYNDQKLIDFNNSRLENVGSPVEDSDAVTKKYADTESKAAKHFIFDSDDNIIGVKIKDQVNNYNYIMCMRNGTLATTCAAKSIAITTNPTKMTYISGDSIDTTDMIVTATCEDETTREITNYTCTNTVTTDNPVFTISYAEGGATFTTTLTVTVNAAS